jgi:hypothetical protein
MGRGEVDADQCTISRLATDFNASGGNLRELLVALARNDGFRYRAPIPAEVCQ